MVLVHLERLRGEAHNRCMDIRKTRTSKGITIDEIAHRTGIDRSRISRAERGYLQFSSEERKRIASCLGVPAKKLTTPSSIDG